jgi:hypothetical protein
MIAEKIDMPGIKFGIAHSNDNLEYREQMRCHVGAPIA